MSVSALPATTRIVMYDESHGSVLVDQWLSVSISHDKHIGTATVALPYAGSVAASLLQNPTHDYIGYYVAIYYRDFDDALFWGALTHIQWGWAYGEWAVQLTFESIFANTWRRVLAQTGDNSKFYNASIASLEADLLAQRMMKSGLGVLYASGGMFTSATYSGFTVNRGDSAQFTPWTITVPSLHSPALSATTLRMEQPSGSNMLDALLDIAERGDIAFTTTLAGTGAFEFDSTGTYQRNDVSASVVLSDAWGTMTGIRVARDYTVVRNMWLVKGDGNQTGQSKQWYQDGSAATIGVYEDTVTLPDVTAADALSAINTRQTNLYAAAIDTVDVTLNEGGGVLFNSTFGLRDKVTVYCHNLTAYTAALVVVGYKLDIASNGLVSVAVTLNANPRRLSEDVRPWQPGPGGRGGGGLFTLKDG